jgi:hypothetical protein
MSFDLYFLALGPGETWQEAMDRLEKAAASPAGLDDQDLAQWDAVRAVVKPLLPGAEEFSGDGRRELSDGGSGIQLALSHGELSLTIPYWYSGPDAPFLGEGEQTAVATFDQVEAALRPGRLPMDRETGRLKRLFRRSR